MIARLTTSEVAALLRRHPGTVRLALEDGTLHGTQMSVGGRWMVREDCAEAYADRVPCAHQQVNVTDIKSRRRA
jgi:excisionase family DNA binding protein